MLNIIWPIFIIISIIYAIISGNSKNLIAFKDKLVCPKCAEKIGAIQSTMNEEADE